MELNTVRIDVASSIGAFSLKDQLLSDGLVWWNDFTWRYHPSDSNWDYDMRRSAYVEFTFKDEQLATYYRMKWL